MSDEYRQSPRLRVGLHHQRAANTERRITMDALFEKIAQIKQAILQGDVSALWEMSEHSLTKAFEALLLMIVCYLSGKYLSRLVSAPISSRIDQTLGRFVEKLVYRGCLACGVLLVLAYFGVQSASLAAVLAATGFAIGLAFQGTLSNFASGILLMVFRPFKVGDQVVAGGITARVHEIDLFNTIVDTPDNRRLIIPNNSISSNTIENVTFHEHRRIEIPVGISYSADMDRTREVLQAAIKAVPEGIYEDELKPSQVLLVGLGPSSVEWIVRAWAPTADFSIVRDRLIYQVKKQLDLAGISIPFPQLDIHLSTGQALLQRLQDQPVGSDHEQSLRPTIGESTRDRQRMTPRRSDGQAA
jgi:small conductance mechanosensitive channel